MKDEMSYEEFKDAVVKELKTKIYVGLSEEQQRLWEEKVDLIEQKDVDDVCREHYNSKNRSVESCAWCLHMFA